MKHAMEPALTVRLSQRLNLTPALRASLNILRMNQLELAELIQAELAENPLLVAENHPENHPGPPTPSMRGMGDAALDRIMHQQGLVEQLRAQIGMTRANALTRDIALFLAGDLTDEGYLSDSDAKLAEMLKVPLEQLREGIRLLQSCEPTGIGARNLRECLDLQLAALGQDAQTRAAILDNLGLFARRDWAGLAHVTGLPQSTLRKKARLLAALDPHPGRTAQPEPVEYLRADLRIDVGPDGMWRVELADSDLPALRIDDALLARADGQDRETARYLRDKARQAQDLINAMAARGKTLLRVGEAILHHQHRFFAQGGDHLIPFTQRALAERLGLHPSTIARAIAGKAIESPHGLHPVRFFFPSSVSGVNDADALSSFAVQQQIRRLIGRETAETVLSDARIAILLRESGVDIARRTVAKYRQCLKIPSSVQRRKSKKIL